MLSFITVLMLGVAPIQDKKPTFVFTEPRKVVITQPKTVVYVPQNQPQIIVPSGSMHGQMIAYENMQRRIYDLELRQQKAMLNMMNEVTPQYQIGYIGRPTYCGQPYYGGFYNDGRSGLYSRSCR